MDEAKANYIRLLAERQRSLAKSVRRVERDLGLIREDAVISQHMIEHLERDERLPPE